MIRVGINMLFLTERAGGVGRYAVELAAALSRRSDVELTLFIARDDPCCLRSEAWAHRVRFTVMPVSRLDRRRYLAASFAGVPATAAVQQLDVLHSPANTGPFYCPGVRSIITVHDLIWHHAGERWGCRTAVAEMRRASALTVPRAGRVITGSAASAADIVAVLGVDPLKVDVVPLGVSAPGSGDVTPETELRSRFALGDSQVLLCVAQKRPYKRQEVLVRALQELSPGVMLVLPGAPTDYETYLREVAASIGVADRVVFPAWVSQPDLEGLYRLATCFALPSEFEGFGLPVLESMARGLAVACSDRAALPELAAGAAVLFDPDDQAATTRAVASILADSELRETLKAAGLQRAAAFTWDRTAEATVGTYLLSMSA